MWLTSINGTFNDKLNDLAKEVPTRSDPKRPGPLVNAILVKSEV